MIHNTQDWIGQSLTQEEIVNSNNHKDWMGQLREMQWHVAGKKKVRMVQIKD